MLPERGDVWWCESPDAGRRPGVVLTRDATISRLRMALVAFATTNRRNLPTEVPLEPDDDPVPLPCVLALDTPQLVPVSWHTQRLGSLGADRMGEVCRAMAIAIDCD